MRIAGIRSVFASALTFVLAAGVTPGATPAATGTAARAAFLSHAFTDVRGGTQFRLGDFQGKQVLALGGFVQRYR